MGDRHICIHVYISRLTKFLYTCIHVYILCAHVYLCVYVYTCTHLRTDALFSAYMIIYIRVKNVCIRVYIVYTPTHLRTEFPYTRIHTFLYIYIRIFKQKTARTFVCRNNSAAQCIVLILSWHHMCMCVCVCVHKNIPKQTAP